LVSVPPSRRRGSELTFVVLGAGAMGRITARDLAETAPNGSTVVIADADANVAARVTSSLPRSRHLVLRSASVDAAEPRRVAALLKSVNAFAIINATHHRFNIAVMDAALAAGAHYCDLGGLFHHTRAQLRRHATWKSADRLALVGIGAAPGIVNVLARSAADTMDVVREIHVAVAGVDRTRGRRMPPFGVSYSVRTLLEEASQPAAVFRDGRVRFEPPMSGAHEVRFPSPVGWQVPALTLHSEVATLPRSYRRKRIRECTFRIALPPATVQHLTLLREIGLLSTTPIRIGGAVVAPREWLVAVIERAASPQWRGIPDEYEILRVVVRGRRNRTAVEDTIDCHVRGNRAWRVGIDIDTGCPPSIAMQMLARGEITARGVVAPEQAVPVKPFFRELQHRGMLIRTRRRPWSSPA
jgi:saccharopine dehydrogenase-like NADP-dependent oxidoreductase